MKKKRRNAAMKARVSRGSIVTRRESSEEPAEFVLIVTVRGYTGTGDAWNRVSGPADARSAVEPAGLAVCAIARFRTSSETYDAFSSRRPVLGSIVPAVSGRFCRTPPAELDGFARETTDAS
jgi:hypothetical protein